MKLRKISVLVLLLIVSGSASLAADFEVTDISLDRSSTSRSQVSFQLDVTIDNKAYTGFRPRFYIQINNYDSSSGNTDLIGTEYWCSDEIVGSQGQTYDPNEIDLPEMSTSVDHSEEDDNIGVVVEYISAYGQTTNTCDDRDDRKYIERGVLVHTYSEQNSNPSASISANTTNIRAGQEVKFDFSGSDSDGSVDMMQVDFGDGESSPEYSSGGSRTVTHEYTYSGDFTATLDVKDDDDATTTDSTDNIDVQPDCSFYTSYYYPPHPDVAILGEDMSVDFQVAHNDASNCPSASDINFEVCGTNLTAPDHVSASTYTDYYGNSYDSFTASFTVQSDVTCNSQSNTVTFWNTDTGEKIADSTLNIIRGSTRGTPIHDNGDYKPQAEIIVATEMSHPRTDYYDLQSENVANKSDTKFFICRGDYRGQNISESKLVKVQQGTSGSYSWQYYRCAMNGSWMDAQCQPGQELRYDTQDQRYECFMKATQTITATYFDINSIPHSGKSNGYLAGFKIPETEIQEYNEVMGFDPQKVDAECWMGDDNQRPTSASDSAVFTSTYSGTGDLWAIAEIPARSGVNKNTYSCVWGMKNVGSTTDTNVYESTNNIPLKARDGGKESITYDRIETRSVSADVDTGTARDVWSKYEAPSDGGYDQRTYSLGNHFMLNGEYPYCSGNTFLGSNPQRNKASILQNVLCTGSGGYSGYPDTFNNPP